MCEGFHKGYTREFPFSIPSTVLLCVLSSWWGAGILVLSVDSDTGCEGTNGVRGAGSHCPSHSGEETWLFSYLYYFMGEVLTCYKVGVSWAQGEKKLVTQLAITAANPWHNQFINRKGLFGLIVWGRALLSCWGAGEGQFIVVEKSDGEEPCCSWQEKQTQRCSSLTHRCTPNNLEMSR